MDDTLVIREESGIAAVTFNRPMARHAMNAGMVERLPRESARLGRSGHTRVVVLRGAGGRAVASGADLTEMGRMDSARALDHHRRFEVMLAAIETSGLPVIAMIEGYALGGGCGVAVACDLRVVSPDARFGIPIARIRRCMRHCGHAAGLDAAGFSEEEQRNGL
jgi:enoyl-CoA hydratase